MQFKIVKEQWLSSFCAMPLRSAVNLGTDQLIFSALPWTSSQMLITPDHPKTQHQRHKAMAFPVFNQQRVPDHFWHVWAKVWNLKLKQANSPWMAHIVLLYSFAYALSFLQKLLQLPHCFPHTFLPNDGRLAVPCLWWLFFFLYSGDNASSNAKH